MKRKAMALVILLALLTIPFGFGAKEKDPPFGPAGRKANQIGAIRGVVDGEYCMSPRESSSYPEWSFVRFSQGKYTVYYFFFVGDEEYKIWMTIDQNVITGTYTTDEEYAGIRLVGGPSGVPCHASAHEEGYPPRGSNTVDEYGLREVGEGLGSFTVELTREPDGKGYYVYSGVINAYLEERELENPRHMSVENCEFWFVLPTDAWDAWNEEQREQAETVL